MIPVKGYPNLYRDEKTGAIVNCDSVSYNQHLISKKKRELQQNEINELKSEISEIKILLKQLLEKNGSI